MRHRTVRLGFRPTADRVAPHGDDVVLVAEVVAEQRVVARLEHAGATTAARARRLSDLSQVEAASLDALLESGIVREAAPGSYYVDEETYQAQRPIRRSLSGALFLTLVVLTFLVVVVGVVYVW